MPIIERDPIFDSNDAQLEAVARGMAIEQGLDPNAFDSIVVGTTLQDNGDNNPIIEIHPLWRNFLPAADDVVRNRLRSPTLLLDKDIITTPIEGMLAYDFSGDEPVFFNGTIFTSIGTGNINGIDFTFTYKTTTQAIQIQDTWEDVTFDTNAEIDGWTHTGGSADFICPTTGKYKVNLDLSVMTSSNNKLISIRALFNASEIAGTHRGLEFSNTDKVMPVVTQFILNGTAGQILKFQWSGNSAGNIFIQPGPDQGGGAIDTAGAVVITRLT